MAHILDPHKRDGIKYAVRACISVESERLKDTLIQHLVDLMESIILDLKTSPEKVDKIGQQR